MAKVTLLNPPNLLPLLNVCSHAIRLLLGGVFLWASIPKILDPELLLTHIQAYAMVGPRSAAMVAVTLPWLEFILGLCLMMSIALRGAYLVATLLLGAFVAAQVSVIYRGLAIDCGCGLPGSVGLISLATVFRTSILTAIALIGCTVIGMKSEDRSQKSEDRSQKSEG